MKRAREFVPLANFAGVGGECMEIKTIKRYVSIFGGVLGGMTSDTCSNGDVTV